MNLCPSILHRLMTALLFAWLSAQASAEEVKPYKYGKNFIGSESEAITIVPLEPPSENQFLIRFQRVEGYWDDRILLHKHKACDGKDDYAVKDQYYVSVVVRGGSYGVYPRGSCKELNVFFRSRF